MNYLSTAIAQGVLELSCPNCGRSSFQESGLGCNLLHCNTCFTHTSPIEWVTKVIRQGDDDPYIRLSITRTETSYVVQVNTDRRASEGAEAIRFCVIGGARSVNTLTMLADISSALSITNRPSVRLRGVKGQLKIYQQKGSPDIWVKTEDVEADVYCGAQIEFPLTSEVVPYIRWLMEAMLLDIELHPLPLLPLEGDTSLT